MSLTKILIRIVGAILVIVGLALVLSAVGFTLAFLPSATFLGGQLGSLIVGLILIIFGAYLALGGVPSV